ncbi:MAG: hypothetical protein WB816_13960 [Methylocystis sp.]
MRPRQFERAAWSLGVIGLVASGAGFFLEPALFPFAWLAATICWIGWPLGCMGLLLIHSLTGGNWGYVIRRELATGAGALALAPIVAIPLAVTAPSLYPWLRAGVSEHLSNGFYLNLPWFLARCAVYFCVWLALAWLILRALRRADAGPALSRLAPPGLILLALTVTFASIDMIEALDPKFASSVFGLMTIAEMGLFALSVSVLAKGLAHTGDAEILGALGRLMLALAILWAYLDFVQLLIVWQSNLPREARWYGMRWTGHWGMVAGLVALFHFVLPFALLLSPRLKRSNTGMAFVAALLIMGGVLRDWWLVLPASKASWGFVPLAAMLGVWGVATGFALRAPFASRPAKGGLRDA